MPQDIRVLQCFECEIFQVDIVKKVNKWKCRVCGTQQSLRKVHFLGTGSECRSKVKELNMKKGQRQNEELNFMLELSSKSNFNDEANDEIDCSEIGGDTRNTEQEKQTDCIEEVGSNNMFNFSNTQKWTSDNSLSRNRLQKITKTSNLENNNVTKKSKWDAYV